MEPKTNSRAESYVYIFSALVSQKQNLEDHF